MILYDADIQKDIAMHSYMDFMVDVERRWDENSRFVASLTNKVTAINYYSCVSIEVHTT